MKTTKYVLLGLLSFAFISCSDTKKEDDESNSRRREKAETEKTERKRERTGKKNIFRDIFNPSQSEDESARADSLARDRYYADSVDRVYRRLRADSVARDSAYYYEEYAPAMCDSTVYYDSISAW